MKFIFLDFCDFLVFTFVNFLQNQFSFFISGVDQKYLEETLITESIDPSVEEDLLPLPKGMSLDKSVFDFPKCQVSQTTFKVRDLVKETLEEACNPDATPFYAGRLLVTARNLVFGIFNGNCNQ